MLLAYVRISAISVSYLAFIYGRESMFVLLR